MRFFISFFFLAAATLFADPNWAFGYAKAFEKAKQQEKGVMIMLSQENCDACWYMENIVFEESDLTREIENEFVPLYLDVKDDDLHGLKFSSTPTLYFMGSDGEIIKRLDGVFNIKELTAALLKIKVETVEQTP